MLGSLTSVFKTAFTNMEAACLHARDTAERLYNCTPFSLTTAPLTATAVPHLKAKHIQPFPYF